MTYKYNLYNFTPRLKILLEFKGKIRSNGDGKFRLPDDLFIDGEIGNIDDHGFIYIKNNILGKKIVDEKYKYEYVITYYHNKITTIEFLDTNNKVIPLTYKCSICGDYKIVGYNFMHHQPYFLDEGELRKYYFVCKECFRTQTTKCRRCERMYLNIDIKYVSEEDYYLCKQCYKEMFFICGGCEENSNRNNMLTGINGVSYCEECWNLRYIRCEVCENVRYREVVNYSEKYEMWYCINCTPLYRIIKQYSFRPPKWEYKKIKNEKDLFLGVELEIEPNVTLTNNIPESELQEMAFNFKQFLDKMYLSNLFYFKKDGSIRGFEIVTHPFTLKYSHKNIKWREIFAWLLEHQFNSYRNGRCGLHIHLDKKYFYRHTELMKLRTLFAKCQMEIFNFSKREGTGTEFCQYENFNRKEFFRVFNRSGRHVSINLNTNKNTVEMRVFRGTLNHVRFIACLQFADACASFVKEFGVNFFIIKDNEVIWSYFLEWLKRKNYYANLLEYLTNSNIKNYNQQGEI